MTASLNCRCTELASLKQDVKRQQDEHVEAVHQLRQTLQHEKTQSLSESMQQQMLQANLSNAERSQQAAEAKTE